MESSCFKCFADEVMETKANTFKQKFCFNSLRLMERNDFNSTSKCFSDSELEKKDCQINTKKKHTRSRSVSDVNTCDNDWFRNKKYEGEMNKDQPMTVDSKSEMQSSANEITDTTDTGKVNLMSVSSILHGIIENHSYDKNESESLPASADNKIEDANPSILTISQEKTVFPEISSFKPMLENTMSSGTMGENIIGQPRCLTLKKCITSTNPFLIDDSLIFEPDFEDNDPLRKISTTRGQSLNDKTSDMFFDEEEITSCKESSRVDREEGELSPDLHPISSEFGTEKDSDLKLNAEFFNKINECLRELDKKCREFYTWSIPKNSIKHLQRILSIVDNIKRKLTFLLNSKNINRERTRKPNINSKKYSNSRNRQKDGYEQNMTDMHPLRDKLNKLSSSSRNRSRSDYKHQSKYTDNDRFSSEFNTHQNHKENTETNREIDSTHSRKSDDLDKKDSENDSKHISHGSKESHRRRRRSSRDKPSQTDLLNRKKISILEKLGTKQEIQRVQSLFKRQMNLINKHVVQKREVHHFTRKSERSRKRHSPKKQVGLSHRSAHEKINLGSLKTLEDMESFLDSLKNTASDKLLVEQYVKDGNTKGVLKFTSKKEKRMKPQDVEIVIQAKTSSIKVIPEKDSNAELFKQSINKEGLVILASQDQGNSSQLDKLKRKEIVSEIKELKSSTPKIHPLQENEEHLKVNKSSNLGNNADFISGAENKINEEKRIKSSTDINKIQKERKNINCAEESIVSLNKNKKVPSEEITDSDLAKGTSKIKHLHSSKTLHNYKISQTKKQESSRQKRHHAKEHSNFESVIEQEKQIRKRRKTSKHLTPPTKLISDEREVEEKQRHKSEIKYISDSKNANRDASESLIKNFLSKKIFILGDENVGVLNSPFCLKVIGNEIYLKKRSRRKRKRKSHLRTGSKQSSRDLKSIKRNYRNPKKCSEETKSETVDTENVDTTLEEMEIFLQDLRSKKKVSDDEQYSMDISNPHAREEKFLARIQAKRKAKLMACVSVTSNCTEKEAKFLKAFEKRDKREMRQKENGTSDMETHKQKLMEKIRAETDAVVLAPKPGAKQNPSNTDEEQLIDVKTILNMIKEAESANEEISKQVYVPFQLKRSDMREELENLTTGMTSSLSDESQKFLNNVRAKMRAKKTPVTSISSLMLKPED